MKKRDRIISFIVKPPIWVCIAIWVGFFMCVGGSAGLYLAGLGLNLWALPFYIVALVMFVLSIYAVLAVFGVPKRASKSTFVKKFFSGYNVRAFVYAAGSVLFNICYITFGIIIAALEKSAWLGVLVGYHVFLIVPRATVFYIKKRGDGKREIQNVRAYAYCGFALTLLALAVVPVIRMVMDDQNTYNYFASGIVYVTTIAVYSFAKLGIALYNLRKVRKYDDMSLKAIKNVSFADALISIFALQAMMLKELGSGTADPAVLNPVVGGLVSFGIFAMGAFMMARGFKLIKRVGADEAEKDDVAGETDESVNEDSGEISVNGGVNGELG